MNIDIETISLIWSMHFINDSSFMLQGIRTIIENYNLFSLNGKGYAESFYSSIVTEKTEKVLSSILVYIHGFNTINGVEYV